MNIDENDLLSVEVLNEETIETLKKLIPSLSRIENLEKISSIAFFTDKNSIFVYQSDKVEQRAVSLTLAANESESINYYTTYDETKRPVLCCAHRVTKVNGIISSHEQVFGEANSVIAYQGKYYYFLYKPSESISKRCCVHNAIQVVDGNGQLVWKPTGPALFCGN